MIFITGAARSGTSLTTKILQSHGLNLGAAGSINSLYENLDIRENVIKPYLESMGADRLGQDPLPDIARLPPFKNFREEILKLFHVLPTEPFGYKDAKLTLIWPILVEAFPEAKYVIVRRDTEKIIDSCLRTSFMRSHKDREGWGGWVDHHLVQFGHIRESVEAMEIWPENYIAKPEAFRAVANFCGLEFDAEKVTKALNMEQWHG